MSASKENLHSRLRARTRALHEDLERAVGVSERIATRPRYAGYLKQLWGLHSQVEKTLNGLDFRPYGFVYPYPYRSRLLEDDLEALGVPREEIEAAPLPRPPRLADIPAGLGCLYVVEGSAKGARAILPSIAASIGCDARSGASFFHGFGRETGRMWQACLAAINAVDADSSEADRAVEAAVETFAMFREGLTPRSDVRSATAPDRRHAAIGTVTP